VLQLLRRRIPVTVGSRIVEFAGPERVYRLRQAPNALLRLHKNRIASVELVPYGEDYRVKTGSGNPQKLSHRAETSDNPKNVWTFKRLLPASTTSESPEASPVLGTTSRCAACQA